MATPNLAGISVEVRLMIFQQVWRDTPDFFITTGVRSGTRQRMLLRRDCEGFPPPNRVPGTAPSSFWFLANRQICNEAMRQFHRDTTAYHISDIDYSTNNAIYKNHSVKDDWLFDIPDYIDPVPKESALLSPFRTRKLRLRDEILVTTSFDAGKYDKLYARIHIIPTKSPVDLQDIHGVSQEDLKALRCPRLLSDQFLPRDLHFGILLLNVENEDRLLYYGATPPQIRTDINFWGIKILQKPKPNRIAVDLHTYDDDNIPSGVRDAVVNTIERRCREMLGTQNYSVTVGEFDRWKIQDFTSTTYTFANLDFPVPIPF